MEQKCVLVIDKRLPTGLVANTAVILGLSLGKLFPTVVGQDVYDIEGNRHVGITEIPVPVLAADAESLRNLRGQLFQPEFGEVEAVDFSDLAQSCKTYEEFTSRMGETREGALQYLGVALCGSKKLVNRLCGSLPLLR